MRAGTSEVDQVDRIQSVLGQPPQKVLEAFAKQSGYAAQFAFAPRQGSGIGSLIPHASAEAVDLMERLLRYDPGQRLSCAQALQHPFFAALRCGITLLERCLKTFPLLQQTLRLAEVLALQSL